MAAVLAIRSITTQMDVWDSEKHQLLQFSGLVWVKWDIYLAFHSHHQNFILKIFEDETC